MQFLRFGGGPSVFGDFDSWIRRRLRMSTWKNWKKRSKKARKLIGLGEQKVKA
ncbi:MULTISPECIES: group II intron maturase-specific domain-containing protein [Sporosarcina]|uniref:group II intron maturase-specific domain-containing protein n=1 Tax=Sporosarcina TaxID=1569 RepID=UPI001E58A95E|nr:MULTISPECIES: group II intron maturase-specific domain-containing protein [Sporosarcina]